MSDKFKQNSHAWWTRTKPNGGPRKTWETVTSLVRVMTIAEGYAMARNAGAMPFAVPLSELEFIRETPAARKEKTNG